MEYITVKLQYERYHNMGMDKKKVIHVGMGREKEKFLRGGDVEDKEVLITKRRIPGREIFMYRSMELVLKYKE